VRRLLDDPDIKKLVTISMVGILQPAGTANQPGTRLQLTNESAFPLTQIHICVRFLTPGGVLVAKTLVFTRDQIAPGETVSIDNVTLGILLGRNLPLFRPVLEIKTSLQGSAKATARWATQ
jgi:hypothetical protein